MLAVRHEHDDAPVLQGAPDLGIVHVDVVACHGGSTRRGGVRVAPGGRRRHARIFGSARGASARTLGLEEVRCSISAARWRSSRAEAGESVPKLARVLARQGAAVAVNDLSEDSAEPAAAAIRDAGGRAVAAAFDVTDAAACQAGVAAVGAALGPIDLLVNNAGGTPDGMWPTSFLKTPRDRWPAFLGMNLLGVLNCCHAVVGGMAERGYGPRGGGLVRCRACGQPRFDDLQRGEGRGRGLPAVAREGGRSPGRDLQLGRSRAHRHGARRVPRGDRRRGSLPDRAQSAPPATWPPEWPTSFPKKRAG